MIIVDLGIHKLKRILTFGDSWVEGGSLDDHLINKYGIDLHFSSPEETVYTSMGRYKDSYRFKYSWTGYLDRLLDSTRDDWSVDKPQLDNIERGALNYGRGGLSNAGIVDKVLKIISVFNGTIDSHEGFYKYGWSGDPKDEFTEDKFNPNDYFVIVSWTTFYRDHMFNMHGDGKYQTWGINSLWDGANENMNSHVESYIDSIFNLPYLMEKYLNQCLYLHYFLKSCNVKHMFFNSFNETVDLVKSIHNHKLIEMDELEETIQHNTGEVPYLTELFSMLPKDIFYKDKMFGNSQLAFLLKQLDNYPANDKKYKILERPKGYSRLFLDDMHPSELGNELWSNELYNTEQVQEFLK